MAFDASFLVPQMSPTEIDFEKIEMQVLKVHIHCDGCKRKVKKILRQIEGVFEVDIDKEQQKVIITGTANIDTVIKKLINSGKHAEIWASNEDQNLRFNDWFSRDLGLETDDKGVYSGCGFYDGMNRSTIDNKGNAYEGDADLLSNMMPMMSIENIDGENAGFDNLSSFNYPSLVKMMNMQGRERNQTVPMMMMNANMNNREMPQYMQEINNMNSRYMQETNNANNLNRYMQEMKNMNNLVIPQQMQDMDNMNQLMPQYTPEMNNMNDHLMPRYMQEIGNLNNRVMPRYIRETENMNGHVMPQYTREMNYMYSQLMPHHIQEMSNMNNVVMPQYMQETRNMNSHVRPQDRYGNQLQMTDYASPFLPDYYTVPYPYRSNYNHNNFF